jgi:eukaryotic-like serine/threonine-protein kinase
MMHMHDPVPNVKSLNPDVPDALVAVINKALAKDPNDRFQTAAQMAAALRNVLGQGRAPSATMVEDATMNAAKRGTTVEKPYAGTVVESTPVSSGIKGTMVESPAPSSSYPSPVPAGSGAPKPKSRSTLPIIAGVIIGLICLVAVGAFAASQLFGGGGTNPTEPPVVLPTDTQPAPATEAPPVIESTATLSITETPAATPTETVPPGIPFVRITSITLDGSNYVINFETFEYTPAAECRFTGIGSLGFVRRSQPVFQNDGIPAAICRHANLRACGEQQPFHPAKQR